MNFQIYKERWSAKELRSKILYPNMPQPAQQFVTKNISKLIDKSHTQM